MAIEIVLPRLGWNMEKGSLGEWLKRDGDHVEVGEIIFTVEGEKAVQEIEALDSGILRIPADSPPPGKEVPVGTLLAYLLQPGEAVPSAAGKIPSETVRPTAARSTGVVAPPSPRVVATGVAISPRARRAARELGLDWTVLAGSGRTGRIVERDVRQAAQAKPAPLVPVVSIQQGTAAHVRPAAQASLATEADATEIVRLQSHLQGATEPAPSYTDLLVKVVAIALTHYPGLNARIEGGAVVAQPTMNISIAVDTQDSFVVAVLRDAQAKSLRQIARESQQLAERARSGDIGGHYLRDSTFAIINLGPHDMDVFTPVLNAGQCAVLGAGRIVAKQVVLDAQAGQVAIRHMMFLSLAFDPRAVDGASAVRFLEHVKLLVEKPFLWLLR